MKMVEMAKATAPLSSYAQKVRKGPVILTDGGRPVAALVSLEDIDLETLTLSANPQFLALIARSRQRIKSEGAISIHEMRRRLGSKRPVRRR